MRLQRCWKGRQADRPSMFHKHAHRAGQLRAELAAVPARHRRDRQPRERTLASLSRIRYEELLSVHAVVQRQARELQVDAHVEPPARAQRHRPAPPTGRGLGLGLLHGALYQGLGRFWGF